MKPKEAKKPREVSQDDLRVGTRVKHLVIIDVVRIITKGGKNVVAYKCKCDCGRECIYQRYSFLRGKVSSCGCQKALNNRTHGKTKTRTYRIYHAMMQRCYDKTQRCYSRYGGAGVNVCERWRDSFENFLFDMGECPSDKHSIDRIDVRGNYGPSNCRWATDSEQARNKRGTVKIPYKGREQCLADVADSIGMKYTTLYMRIFHYGWPIEKAISTSIDTSRHKHTHYNGR